MKRVKYLLGALACMLMVFVITPVVHAEEGTPTAQAEVKNGWVLENGNYYYYEDDVMLTSTLIEDANGYTYYVGEDGIMVKDEHLWTGDGYRYFNTAGAMLKSSWRKEVVYDEEYEASYTYWYYYGVDGIAYTGVQKVGSVEYAFWGDGQLADYAGVLYDEVNLYKVSATGVVVAKVKINYANWTYMDGEWYWFDGVYSPASGMREINGHTYYFGWDEPGQMVTNEMIWVSEENTTKAFNANGIMVENGWYLNIDGNERRWYYFGENGFPADGWVLSGGSWYYVDYGAVRMGDYIMEYNGQNFYFSFDTDGRMLKQVAVPNGWFTVDGDWYYYNGDRLLKDEWAMIGNATYYFAYNGRMATSDIIWAEEEVYYIVDENGHWAINEWVLVYGEWTYADENGVAVLNEWKFINGQWYYFDEIFMATNPTMIDGTLYLFNEYGTYLGASDVTTGWIAARGSWYYLENGEFAIGWKLIGGNWYYFDEDSYLALCNDWYSIDGKNYAFGASGALANGWVLTEYGSWVLADSAGVLKTGWQLVGSTWYYLDYEMYEDGLYWVDGAYHLFADNGAWLGKLDTSKDGWVLANGNWYWIEDGQPQSGIMLIDGKVYCMVHEMITNDYIWTYYGYDPDRLGTSEYVLGFDASGVLAQNKWVYIEELQEWIWFDKEGIGVVKGLYYYY